LAETILPAEILVVPHHPYRLSDPTLLVTTVAPEAGESIDFSLLDASTPLSPSHSFEREEILTVHLPLAIVFR